MTAFDEGNLRIARRVDGLAADGLVYAVRLTKTGTYDGPAYTSWQYSRLVASIVWLWVRRERRWDVTVERAGQPCWVGRCPDHDLAVALGARIAEQIRADGRFSPPNP